MKSGNRNFLESSGPLQACKGTDLPLPLHSTCNKIKFKKTNRGDLSPLRHIPCELEDASGVSIYILVCPGHSVGSGDTGKPVMGYDILLL